MGQRISEVAEHGCKWTEEGSQRNKKLGALEAAYGWAPSSDARSELSSESLSELRASGRATAKPVADPPSPPTVGEAATPAKMKGRFLGVNQYVDCVAEPNAQCDFAHLGGSRYHVLGGQQVTLH